MNIFIEYSALDNCVNPDSFGEICVHCNACGRFDKSTQKKCELQLYKRLLKEEYEFNRWDDNADFRKLQEKNRKANIAYYKKKIEEIESEEE